MEPIEVLRIEQTTISKEIARFRVCDPDTRCFYCRDWAQYIYKKHFVYTAKTQEEIPDLAYPSTVTAGPYHINYAGESDIKKEDCKRLLESFKELADTSADSLLPHMIDMCKQWITAPSAQSLPDLFEPVIFNPYPDAIPLVEDAKDPSQLLDPLIIERQAICLPSDSFHLLKNLTGDILLSHTQPTCHHKKPESLNPAELDVEKAIFNENEQTIVQKSLTHLSETLNDVWHPLNMYLDKMQTLDKEYAYLMGRECQASIDHYFQSQHFVSLNDLWTTKYSLMFTKKKSSDEVTKIDAIIDDYSTHLKTISTAFVKEYVPQRFQDISQFMARLRTDIEIDDTLLKKRYEHGHPNISPPDFDYNRLMTLLGTSDVFDETKNRVMTELITRLSGYHQDIDSLVSYYRQSRPTVSSRIDRITHKDFKKKVKKVEGTYYSIRQYLRYELTEKLYLESNFCRLFLGPLNYLMKEGEMMEIMAIQQEIKDFTERHKDLLEKRDDILDSFEEGVQDGRRELAGILGKLFLKEGMRIQGDNLAIERQNTLLKSMGIPVPEEDTPKKKKKNKKSNGTEQKKTEVTPTPTSSKENIKKSSIETRNNKNPSPSVSVSNPTDDKNKPCSLSPTLVSKTDNQAENEIQDWDSIKKSVHEVSKNITTGKNKSSSSDSIKIEVNNSKEEGWSSIARKTFIAPTPPITATVSKPIKKAQEESWPSILKKTSPITDTKVPNNEDGWSSVVKKVSIPAIDTAYEHPVDSIVEEEQWPSVGKNESTTGDKYTAFKSTQEDGWSSIVKKAPSTEQKENTVIDEVKEEGWPTVVSTDMPVKETKEDGWPILVKEVATDIMKNDDIPVDNWSSLVKEVSTDSMKKNVVSNEVKQGKWPSLVEEVAKDDNIHVDEWSSFVKKVPSTDNMTHDTQVNTLQDNGWSSLAKTSPTDINKTANTWTDPLTVNEGWNAQNGDYAWKQKKENVTDEVKKVSAQTEGVDVWESVDSSGIDVGGWSKTRPVKEGGWQSDGLEKQSIGGWEVTNTVEANKGWQTNTVDTTAVKDWNDNKRYAHTSSKDKEVPNTVDHSKNRSVGKWESSSAADSIGGWGISTTTDTSGGWKQTDVGEEWKPDNNWIPSDINKKDDWRQKKVNSHTEEGWKQEKTSDGNWRTKHPKDTKPYTEREKKTKTWNEKPRTEIPPGLTPTEPQLSSNVPVFNVQPTATSNVPVFNDMPTISPFVMPLSPHLQFQTPLPDNLQELSKEHLVVIIQNIHRENSQLIQHIYSMQQEMNLFTTRYTEIMTLSREREAQALQLFEARKQTEMEEKRLYVLNLENRIKQLEEQVKSTQGDRITAGFGNQDLFAGYREEMRTTGDNHHHHRGHHSANKRLWQKNTTVRCGNCGELGHASADCKGLCRYCGSLEHLSEACPIN